VGDAQGLLLLVLLRAALCALGADSTTAASIPPSHLINHMQTYCRRLKAIETNCNSKGGK
jgi:hypothetical protein